jgi:co-chaperonin GroES (HSP10)|tara:strand:+ start:337 stop:765 length:429 start_codon:yes stop_codon:yes gene_type:complete
MTSTTGLIVPKEKKIVGIKPAEKKEEKETALSKVPKPTGWRILVLPYRGIGKTKGGVILTDKAVEEQQIASVCALVLEVGPDAYADKDKFPNGPWCKKGEWVIIARYAGSRIKIEEGELRILNDDEILGTVDSPEDILGVYT